MESQDITWMVIPEGGYGSSYDESSKRKKGKRKIRTYVGQEICQKLNLPYYGFILYHSANERLRYFLENHLSLLDEITGADFGIFTIVAKYDIRLRIDEIQSGNIDDDLKQKIQRWRERTVPFDPNRCYRIAEALGIPRAHLPCLIIFRTRSNGYRQFAILRLEDSWFPENDNDKDGLDKTVDWLSSLFDALEKSMKIDKKKDAVAEFQQTMDALSRKQKIYQPVFQGLKNGLIPLAQLPFKLIASLPAIIERVSDHMIGKKLSPLLPQKE